MSLVYRHRRKDNLEVFYVGISKNDKRPYNKSGRSDWWKKVAKKYGYEVDIVIKDISIEDAIELEIFMIAEYGRRDIGEGSLVNMSDGGEGAPGFVVPERTKRIVSETHSKIISCYDIDGEYIRTFKSGIEAAGNYGVSDASAILKASRGQRKSAVELQWRKGSSKLNIGKLVRGRTVRPVLLFNKGGKCLKEYGTCKEAAVDLGLEPKTLYKKINKSKPLLNGGYLAYKFPKLTKPFKRPVIQYDKDNNLIKEYKSAREASRHLGLANSSGISGACLKFLSYKGFKWEYK